MVFEYSSFYQQFKDTLVGLTGDSRLALHVFLCSLAFYHCCVHCFGFVDFQNVAVLFSFTFQMITCFDIPFLFFYLY